MLRHILLLLLAALIGGFAGFGCAWFRIRPLYRSSTLLYVNNSVSLGGAALSLSDITASKDLVDTYITILKTRLTLNAVIRQTGLPCSYAQLSAGISAGAVNDTEVLRINVTWPDPVEATLIANTIADVLPAKLYEITEGSSARLVDYAVVPASRVSPSFVRYTIGGMGLGLLFGAALVALSVLLDKRIHGEEYLRSACASPVLGSIPAFAAGEAPIERHGQTVDGKAKGAPPDSVAEAFRLLCVRLSFALPGKTGCRVIGVAGTVADEENSPTALDLSCFLAEAGKRVVLVEADMRGNVSPDADISPGLSDLLAELSSLGEVVQESGASSLLRVLPVGDTPPNPAELLGSENFKAVLETLSSTADYIILDLPPVNEVTDALVAARFTDGIILTLRRDRTTRKALTTATRRLEQAGVKLLGFVLLDAAETRAETGQARGVGRITGILESKRVRRKRVFLRRVAGLSVTLLAVGLGAALNFSYQRDRALQQHLLRLEQEARPYQMELVKIKGELRDASRDLNAGHELPQLVPGVQPVEADDIRRIKAVAQDYSISPTLVLDPTAEAFGDILAAASQTGWEVMLTVSPFGEGAMSAVRAGRRAVQNAGLPLSDAFLLRSTDYSEHSVSRLRSAGFRAFTRYQESIASETDANGLAWFNYIYYRSREADLSRWLSKLFGGQGALLVTVEMEALRNGALTADELRAILSDLNQYAKDRKFEYASSAAVVGQIDSAEGKEAAQYDAYTAERQARIEELRGIIASIYSGSIAAGPDTET